MPHYLYKFVTSNKVSQANSYSSIGKDPDILVLEISNSGSCIVSEYTADGGFCGDNWYPSLEEAYISVSREFDTSAADWVQFGCDAPDLWECLKQAVTAEAKQGLTDED